MTNIKINLASSFNLGGYWWLPEAYDRKVYGQLNYQPDSTPELILEGSFRDPLWDPLELLSNVVIHGETAQGSACTLMDAYEKSHRMHSPGIPTSEFFCNCLFIGKEHILPDKALFESALVQFTDLSTWLLRNPFRLEIPGPAEKERVWKLTYSRPKLISLPIESIRTSIKFESSINSDGENQSYKLIHFDHIRFRPKTKQKLDWYLEVIHNFRILLSLLVGEPVNPISIKLCTRKRRHTTLGNKYYRIYVDFCAPQYQSEKRRKLHPPDILVPYSLIKRDFKKHLNRWYFKADALRTASQLFFGVLVQRDIPLDFLFLVLIQALESYHRTKKGGKYISDTFYEPIKESIINSIPVGVSNDHRAALKSRIRYGNEYSLRKRFNLVLNSMPESLQKKISKNAPKFVAKVVSTRNHLTHRDESDKENVMDTMGILGASESLKILLMVLLLNEIGIDFSTIEKAISSHWRFRRILNIQ